MDEILKDLEFCFTYIDDILVFSHSPHEHDQHLRTLFTQPKKFGILLNPSKCVFRVPEISFLGHKISSLGSQPLPERVTDLQACPLPKTIGQLRRFLGMLNFYRRFLPHAASTQAPFHNILSCPKVKGSHPVTWTDSLLAAFSEWKAILSQAALLAHPDPSATLALVTEASTTAMGAVLQRRVQGGWQPLVFFSRKLSPAQQKYSAYDREILAIYRAVKYFRHVLEARHFTVLTDHKPHTFALHQKRDKCSPRQFNHLDYISQFTTDIRHISGQENIVADAMSRVEAITAPVTHVLLAAAQADDKELRTLLASNTALQLTKIPIPGTSVELYCDTSSGKPRPFVPPRLRLQIFNSLHSVCHPGNRASASSQHRHPSWQLRPPSRSLPTHSHWHSWTSPFLGRISLLPHGYRSLHALAGSFSHPGHHRRDSVTCPSLWLDSTFWLSTNHHHRPRTPVRVAALPQPGEDVQHPPLQDDPPPPRSHRPRANTIQDQIISTNTILDKIIRTNTNQDQGINANIIQDQVMSNNNIQDKVISTNKIQDKDISTNTIQD